MEFRKIARARISQLFPDYNLSVNSVSSQPAQTISLIHNELQSENLSMMIDFIMEFNGSCEYLYGFFFEPYGEFLKIQPVMQKTRNIKSPYFCVKIPVIGMGYIFLIPLHHSCSHDFTLVLRPNRLLRLDVTIGNTTVPAFQTTSLNEPYAGLMSHLTHWAVMKKLSQKD